MMKFSLTSSFTQPVHGLVRIIIVLISVLSTAGLHLFMADQPVMMGGIWLIVCALIGFYIPAWCINLVVILASALALRSDDSQALNWINGISYLVSGLLVSLSWNKIQHMNSRTRALKDRLTEQEAMLTAISSSVPILALDSEGLVYRTNAAANRLFAPDKVNLLGLPFIRLVPAFNPSRPSLPPEGYWTGHRTDSTTFPLNIQFVAIKMPDGRDYLALYLGDLSRWHAADAQARELHTQLNKVWRLNSLGEMAATLAHELNQPLSAAANYLYAGQTEMERLGAAGETAKLNSALAKEQLLRAGQIIRRMRELLSLEIRSLDRDCVASMIEDLRPVLNMIASSRRIVIHVDIDSENDSVRADRIQFQQAIVNLVRNAVEATGTCRPARVELLGRPVSKQAYEISVEDNGPGLPPEEAERIFQPMNTTKSGGMGLGLSVTRTIVERHGGRLTATRSTLGGAAFSFNLMRDPVDGDS